MYGTTHGESESKFFPQDFFLSHIPRFLPNPMAISMPASGPLSTLSSQGIVGPTSNHIYSQSHGKRPMRGKGGKLGGPARFNYNKRLAVGASKPVMRSIMWRAGAKRINGLLYESILNYMEKRSDEVMKLAMLYALHRRAKTISVMDMVYACKHLDRNLYGFGFGKAATADSW